MGKPAREGFHTLTPQVTIKDAVKAIEFYKQAFGAQVRGLHNTPDGRIMHAELKIGDSVLMVNDEFPEMGATSPPGNRVTLNMYVEDVDRVFNQAVAAGATVRMPVMDMFWGDRYGRLEDPFGQHWAIATHMRDVPEEELIKAGREMFEKMNNKSTSAGRPAAQVSAQT